MTKRWSPVTPPTLLRQKISYTPIIWSACERPHRDTLTVCALSKPIPRNRNFFPHAALRDMETERSADPIMLGPRGPTYSFWIQTLGLRLGSPGPQPLSFHFGLSRVVCSWYCLSPRCAPVLATFLCGLVLPRLMSRSEELRQLTVQLALLASLEDVFTHGLQSLFESPAGRIAPISSLPLALYPRLLPLGPAAPSCFARAAPLPVCQELSSCPGSSHRSSGSPASAVDPVESASAACALRAPPCPRPPPRLLSPVRLPPGWFVRDRLAPLGQAQSR